MAFSDKSYIDLFIMSDISRPMVNDAPSSFPAHCAGSLADAAGAPDSIDETLPVQ